MGFSGVLTQRTLEPDVRNRPGNPRPTLPLFPLFIFGSGASDHIPVAPVPTSNHQLVSWRQNDQSFLKISLKLQPL